MYLRAKRGFRRTVAELIVYKVYSNLISLQNKDDEAETQLFRILQRV